MEECGLSEYFDDDELKRQLSMSAGALTEDTGIAFNGGLLVHICKLICISNHLYSFYSKRDFFSTHDVINKKSLMKVCCLMHLSKIYMFEENDNEWEKKKGKLFRFSEHNHKLKSGEWSILIANNNGVKLTAEEFEAIKCFDNKSETNVSNYFENPLTIVVRHANEMAYLIEKVENNK